MFIEWQPLHASPKEMIRSPAAVAWKALADSEPLLIVKRPEADFLEAWRQDKVQQSLEGVEIR